MKTPLQERLEQFGLTVHAPDAPSNGDAYPEDLDALLEEVERRLKLRKEVDNDEPES